MPTRQSSPGAPSRRRVLVSGFPLASSSGAGPLIRSMRYRRTAALAGALIVLVVLSLLLTGCGARPRTAVQGAGVPSGVPVPRLTWTPCDAGFECATAEVPLDYDEPHAGTISLALIRLRATDPARRIGTLFIGPGGPGGSGVEFLRELKGTLYTPEVRARFDLLSFDPRGIARSTPLRCFATAKRAAAARPPYAFPVGERQEQAWLASDGTVARACAQRGGPILHHMSTANVARDLELLRRAVGDRRLTYAGFSYGTYIGETYANLFPGRVRAMVLDGVVDPVAWSTGRGDQARTVPVTLRISADGYDRALRQFFALCTRAGAACAFSHGNPRARWEQLARRLRAHSMRLPDGRTFTYQDLLMITYFPMSEPSLWPQLARWLQAIDTGAVPLPPPIPPASYDPARLAVICSDSDNPASADAWQRAAAAADRRLPHIGRGAAWEPSICRAWRALDPDRYTGPWTRRTSHPVLLVSNRYDPQTPPINARVVARLFPRARLLVIDGWGHLSLSAPSTCAANRIQHYLLTTRLSPRDAACPVDVTPFPSASGTPPLTH
jgi:pimeloyl-ACP methyl ester carboxylesterase